MMTLLYVKFLGYDNAPILKTLNFRLHYVKYSFIQIFWFFFCINNFKMLSKLGYKQLVP